MRTWITGFSVATLLLACGGDDEGGSGSGGWGGGGRGGGRPDMAQGGGNDPSGIPGALERAKTWINAKLTGQTEMDSSP